MDFLFDDISKGRRIKVLNVTDEFTRESLAGQVARSITARDTVAVLQEIVGLLRPGLRSSSYDCAVWPATA